MKKIINTLFLVFLSAFLPIHFSGVARTPQEIVDALLAGENSFTDEDLLADEAVLFQYYNKDTSDIITDQDQLKDIQGAVEILRKKFEQETFGKLNNEFADHLSKESLSSNKKFHFLFYRLMTLKFIRNNAFLQDVFPKNFSELLAEAFSAKNFSNQVRNICSYWASINTVLFAEAFVKVLGKMNLRDAADVAGWIKGFSPETKKSFLNVLLNKCSNDAFEYIINACVQAGQMEIVFAQIPRKPSANMPDASTIVSRIFSCKALRLDWRILKRDIDLLIQGLESRLDKGKNLIDSLPKDSPLCSDGDVWYTLYQKRTYPSALALFNKITEYGNDAIIEKCEELIEKLENLICPSPPSGSAQTNPRDGLQELDECLKMIAGSEVYKRALAGHKKKKPIKDLMSSDSHKKFRGIICGYSWNRTMKDDIENFVPSETAVLTKLEAKLGKDLTVPTFSSLLDKSSEELSELEGLMGQFVDAVQRVRKEKEEKIQKLINSDLYKTFEGIVGEYDETYGNYHERFDKGEVQTRERLHEIFGPFYAYEHSKAYRSLALSSSQDLSQTEGLIGRFLAAIQRVDALVKKERQERAQKEEQDKQRTLKKEEDDRAEALKALQDSEEGKAFEKFLNDRHYDLSLDPAALFTYEERTDFNSLRKMVLGHESNVNWNSYKQQLSAKSPQQLQTINDLIKKFIAARKRVEKKEESFQRLQNLEEYKQFKKFLALNSEINEKDLTSFLEPEKADARRLKELALPWFCYEDNLLFHLPEKEDEIKRLVKSFVDARNRLKSKLEEEKKALEDAKEKLIASKAWDSFDKLIKSKGSSIASFSCNNVTFFEQAERDNLKELRSLTGQTVNDWSFPAWRVQLGNHTSDQLKEIENRMQNFVYAFKRSEDVMNSAQPPFKPNQGWQQKNHPLRGERLGDKAHGGFSHTRSGSNMLPLLVSAAGVATPVIAYKVVQYVRHKLAIRKAVQQIKELRSRLPKGRKLKRKEYAEYLAKKQEIITSLGLEKYVDEIDKHFAVVAG